MSHRRHKHKGQPKLITNKPGINFITESGRVIKHPTLATYSHVYHATKGWRKYRRDTVKGFAIIRALVTNIVG
jgi:hypothetical protein